MIQIYDICENALFDKQFLSTNMRKFKGNDYERIQQYNPDVLKLSKLLLA